MADESGLAQMRRWMERDLYFFVWDRDVAATEYSAGFLLSLYTEVNQYQIRCDRHHAPGVLYCKVTSRKPRAKIAAIEPYLEDKQSVRMIVGHYHEPEFVAAWQVQRGVAAMTQAGI